LIKGLISAFVFFSVLMSAGVAHGGAVYPSGQLIKTIKPGLNLKDQAYVLTGTHDPTVQATDAPQGSIFLRTGASGGTIFSKQDNGLTTNWAPLSANTVITIDEYSNPSGGTLAGARNGVNKTFTITNAPLAGGLFNVILNGVLVDPSDWTIIGQAITLGAGVTAPAAFESVSVNYQYGASSSTTIIAEYSNPSGGTLVGARNGANKAFTITNAPLPGKIFNVYVNGIMIDPSDWSLAALTVTLGAGVTAPAAFESVLINYEY
jgi:hypothetical protein